MTTIWSGTKMSEASLKKLINKDPATMGSNVVNAKQNGLRWFTTVGAAIVFACTDDVNEKKINAYDVLLEGTNDGVFDNDRQLKTLDKAPVIVRVIYAYRKSEEYNTRRANLEQMLYD